MSSHSSYIGSSPRAYSERVARSTRIFAGLEEKAEEPRAPLAPDAQELAAVAGDYEHCEFTGRYSAQGRELLREFKGEKSELLRRAPGCCASNDGQDALSLLGAKENVEYVSSARLSAEKQR
jgi:hypothetical protein